MPRVGHIILNVSDFDRSENFYDLILFAIGFESNYREITQDVCLKSYRSNEHNIWIRREKNAPTMQFVRNVGLDHLALFVDLHDDVNRMYEELSTLNIKITRPPSHYPEYSSNYYAFYFLDPDGIPLEIAYA